MRAVHHLWEAAHLELGETDLEKMDFPALSVEEAFKAFTRAAYGHELSMD